MKGSFAEKALASMFIVGLVLVGGGVIVGARAGKAWVRYSIHHTRGGAPEIVAKLCLAAIVVGAILLLGALVAGLVIAFAPSLFAKPKSGRARVTARFVVQPDGTPAFEEIPEGVPGKRCLRLAFDDGEVGDYHCDERAYGVAPEGSWGMAEVQGHRLLSFRRIPDSQAASRPYDPLGVRR